MIGDWVYNLWNDPMATFRRELFSFSANVETSQENIVRIDISINILFFWFSCSHIVWTNWHVSTHTELSI